MQGVRHSGKTESEAHPQTQAGRGMTMSGNVPGVWVIRSSCMTAGELVQGESPDVVLQRILESKGEMRKNMLQGYMKALDESEGLQQTIARLADRMGVGERAHMQSLCLSRAECTIRAGRASLCRAARHDCRSYHTAACSCNPSSFLWIGVALQVAEQEGGACRHSLCCPQGVAHVPCRPGLPALGYHAKDSLARAPVPAEAGGLHS